MFNIKFKYLTLSLVILIFLISACATQPAQTVCNKPYILVGNDCCLDKDDNSICDKDEQQKTETPAEPTPPEELVVGRCILPTGIACTDFLVTEEGITIVLRNGVGYDIDQVSVDITGCGTGGIGAKYGNFLQNGNEDTYSLICNLDPSGSQFSGKLIVSYRTIDTGLIHRIEGELSSYIG